ncbi:hypothetical protein DL93DRAFT_2079329 [Clavulina sp. PMI_390]|nr:hypothetical protein DL93DRAFT_2079329 [Clavulina sp. PMI_390]
MLHINKNSDRPIESNQWERELETGPMDAFDEAMVLYSETRYETIEVLAQIFNLD